MTDYHYLAHTLSIKCRGRNLSAADKESACQVLLKMHPHNPETLADMCAFKVRAEPFPALIMSDAWLNHFSSVV